MNLVRGSVGLYQFFSCNESRQSTFFFDWLIHVHFLVVPMYEMSCGLVKVKENLDKTK